jgi:fructose-1,6-bisphosphatase I
VVEQAGGKATDGCQSILNLPIEMLHQRVPLCIGSSSMVSEVSYVMEQSKAAIV